MEKFINDQQCSSVNDSSFRVLSVPRTVEAVLTGKCNLKCSYCYYANEMNSLNDLATDEWKKIICALGDHAVQRLILTGGEVFTRSDVFELIDAIIDNKMRFCIISNGTLITDSTIDAFQVGKRLKRLDYIQISIDGSCREIHNASRPPDSFDRAIRGLRKLIDAKIPVTVRVTINRHNYKDLENISSLLLDDIGLAGFGTNEAAQIGAADCSSTNITLDKQQRQEVMRTMAQLNEKYKNRIHASAGPLAMVNRMKKIKQAISEGKREIEGCGKLSACGCVFDKLAILHDGTYTPCVLLPQFALGNACRDNISQIWKNHPDLNALRNRSNYPLRDLASCRDCTFISYCTGGCPASVINQTGDLYSIDPVSCFKEIL